MGNHSTPHLVWDWNGTLLHDTEAVVAATNAAFAELGLAPLTLERYRDTYCVPIPRFYERLLGRVPSQEEWLVMDDTFHRHYTERLAACRLADGAEVLLEGWQSAGRTQSLLSMAGHEQLVPLVTGFGIAERFVRVDGRRGPSGGSKAAHLVRHLRALDGVAPERTVVVGDVLDDAVAAREAGAHAVLHTGGSQSRRSLARGGVPVVDTLDEAVALALELAS
ncbi:HAD family hydrolase [Streptomyces sp. NPDC059740]|uniref:HAD family hydrolase n=1 Tax=Streptomyces sp. NPDC059740 TaxID=3346926 RepID=UPI00364FCFB1